MGYKAWTDLTYGYNLFIYIVLLKQTSLTYSGLQWNSVYTVTYDYKS